MITFLTYPWLIFCFTFPEWNSPPSVIVNAPSCLSFRRCRYNFFESNRLFSCALLVCLFSSCFLSLSPIFLYLFLSLYSYVSTQNLSLHHMKSKKRIEIKSSFGSNHAKKICTWKVYGSCDFTNTMVRAPWPQNGCRITICVFLTWVASKMLFFSDRGALLMPFLHHPRGVSLSFF